MTREKTLVLIKPDAVEREMIGEIVGRLERKGLTIRAMKMLRCSEELARRHYAVHADKPFFPRLLRFITSAPLVALVLDGNEAISVVRTLLGPTDCCLAPPGTIRGDLGCSKGANLVHASDSPEAAEQEMALWFPEGILKWIRADQDWLDPDTDRKSLLRSSSFVEDPALADDQPQPLPH
eukprot:m51a1_g242 nucleoside-diphosphate kinase, putative (180) ;mRNA; r:145767-146387